MSQDILDRVGYNRSKTANSVEVRFIGSLLALPDSISEVYEANDSFPSAAIPGKDTRAAFDAIHSLYDNNDEISPAIVSHRSGIDESFLVDCIKEHNENGCKSAVTYAKILYEKFLKEKAGGMLQEAITALHNSSEDILKSISTVVGDLSALVDTGASRYEKDAGEVMREVMEEILAIRKLKLEGKDTTLLGVPTGLRAVDVLLGGYRASRLHIVAGRVAMGKSARVAKTALEAAMRGYPVGIFTLEMASSELMKRLLSMASQVGSRAMDTGNYRAGEIERIDSQAEVLAKLPMHFNEKGAATLGEIKRYARKWKRLHGLSILLIDYLQIMGTSSNKWKNRTVEIGEISGGLKALAKELKIPVVALAQVGREAEKRGGSKKPMLSDLRESGSIEADADVVEFIYRPEYYGITEDSDGLSLAGIAEIIVAKNRGGATDTERVGFRAEFTEFYDLGDGSFPTKEPAPSTQFPVPDNIQVKPDKRNDDDEIQF